MFQLLSPVVSHMADEFQHVRATLMPPIVEHRGIVGLWRTSTALDIACIDIGLPTESGYEVCEFIRGRFGLKFFPIVVTSDVRSPQFMTYRRVR